MVRLVAFRGELCRAFLDRAKLEALGLAALDAGGKESRLDAACAQVAQFARDRDVIPVPGTVCVLILIFGHQILGIFNNDPEVIQVGYMRLCMIFFAYILSLVQEVGSGYMRGFGMSFVPALVALVCICGLRLFWIFAIFPHWPTFRTIMLIYPISLWTTGIIILLMILIIRPSRKMEASVSKMNQAV